jgi:hypothetical protein
MTSIANNILLSKSPPLRVAFQSSYGEDDDEDRQELLLWLVGKGFQICTMTEKAIWALRASFSNYVDVPLFADSCLVQQILQESQVSVVDTYPEFLRHLLGRVIVRNSAEDFAQKPSFPVFVKPASGHKFAPAGIWRHSQDLAHFSSVCGLKFEWYFSPVCEFLVEWRLYIAAETKPIDPTNEVDLQDGRLAGMCDYSDQLFPEDAWETAEQLDLRFMQFQKNRLQAVPPMEFVQQVVQSVPREQFVVVDIGLMKPVNDELDPRWVVVEVNPPFSITNYGLSIPAYGEFCLAAWSALMHQRARTDAVFAQDQVP